MVLKIFKKKKKEEVKQKENPEITEKLIDNKEQIKTPASPENKLKKTNEKNDSDKNIKLSQPKEKPSQKSPGFFKHLKQGLSTTRTSFTGVFSGNRKINDELLEELEELLITSDMGVETSLNIMKNITKKASGISNAAELKEVLKSEILNLLKTDEKKIKAHKPYIILVVGVNGVGKTTTIGKLASSFSKQGKKVLVAAADTFRAAAVEQLEIWAERSGANIVKHKENSDPAAVAFDSVQAALARDIDIVLVDTAGRLQTKKNLMEELKKIKRAISKKMESAPHETLMILDATTGQNALSQAKLFDEAIGISSFALTKLDGTAKGGIVISISDSINVPIKYIGVGEQIDALQEFDPEKFVDALI